MNSNQLKMKKLLTFDSGCHGNYVTTAMRYVADAYGSKEPLCQIEVELI